MLFRNAKIKIFTTFYNVFVEFHGRLHMFSKVFTSQVQLRIVLRSSKVIFLEQAQSDDFRELSLTVFRLLKVEISPELTLQPLGPTHEN